MVVVGKFYGGHTAEIWARLRPVDVMFTAYRFASLRTRPRRQITRDTGASNSPISRTAKIPPT